MTNPDRAAMNFKLLLIVFSSVTVTVSSAVPHADNGRHQLVVDRIVVKIDQNGPLKGSSQGQHVGVFC